MMLMKQILQRLIIVLSAVLISPIVAMRSYAADPDPFELNLEENLEQPVIPSKKKDDVREIIDRLKVSLERNGFKAARYRKGEVIMITIPCERLFRPNDISLTEKGAEMLTRLKMLDGMKDKFKLLIAVHTDDTGEAGYADSITADRANAVDDCLTERAGLRDMIIIPYGLGRDEPLVSNDSFKNRATNRRVEIYIVPLRTIYSK